MGEKEIKNIMERKKEDVAFKQIEKQADENISKIFNPENAYKRKQKEILREIFGEDASCSVIKKRLNNST